MGRAKREVPTGKLILKYPKTGYDKSKEYTLYYVVLMISLMMSVKCARCLKWYAARSRA
jgi:hypothetical protein